jgi:UDP-N-acetylmuramoyl-tripeptide--D-alanyl-D-alanine ligase
MNSKLSEIYQKFLACKNIVIDTRKIEENSMFLALKGENFDANEFAKKALELGAKYVIIDNEKYYIDTRTILVENTLETLQKLSNFHRKSINIPIIALTGSNGKTTTKELIYAVLAQKFNCKATLGNLNNHIGVPLTLLSFNQETEIGIVEMGANHQKEIEFLCKIAEPNFGYITNFGKAHLEGFGGVEGVIKGKSEMYDYLIMNNKSIFVNLDDNIQVQKTNNYSQKTTFGVKNNATIVNFDHIDCNPFVKVKINNNEIQSNLIGLYNSTNICAAITIGIYFNISIDLIKNGIENYHSDNNRSQIITKNNYEIILDAYNANPSSMKEAIDNFNNLDTKNKLMILGDMFELGIESSKEHQFILDLVLQHNINTIFIGNEFYKQKINHNKLLFFENFKIFEEFLIENPINAQSILIKGSRGMALERILNFL